MCDEELPETDDTNPKITIMERKIIIGEGIDDKKFFRKLCKHCNIVGIQVEKTDGSCNLGTFLKMFQQLPNYEKVESILIIRDSDNNPQSAIDSVRGYIKSSNITKKVPNKPYKFNDDRPKIAFAILPGCPNSGEEPDVYSPGMLEDLCLSTIEVADKDMLDCVDAFLTGAEQCGEVLTHKSKSRAHAYLSVKNRYVGKTIGDAASSGAWDMDSHCLDDIKLLISKM